MNCEESLCGKGASRRWNDAANSTVTADRHSWPDLASLDQCSSLPLCSVRIMYIRPLKGESWAVRHSSRGVSCLSAPVRKRWRIDEFCRQTFDADTCKSFEERVWGPTAIPKPASSWRTASQRWTRPSVVPGRPSLPFTAAGSSPPSTF